MKTINTARFEVGIHDDRKHGWFEHNELGDEWRVEDLEAEGDQFHKYQSNMRDVIQWVAGRILYGA